MYKFTIEENIREIKYIEVIAEDEEDAFEEIFEGKGEIIWRKTIDNDGMRVIKQVKIEED